MTFQRWHFGKNMAKKSINILKPTKDLKNSKEVFEFCVSKKVMNGIMPYKGGIAIVEDGRVKEIYVGPNALENAKKNYGN